MEYFTHTTKEQQCLEKEPGNNPFEPKYLTQDDNGDIYWKKWRDTDKPLVPCNHFRVWVIAKDGETALVNIKELYDKATNVADITSSYWVINRQYFNTR
jgi:hypothetical protein